MIKPRQRFKGTLFVLAMLMLFQLFSMKVSAIPTTSFFLNGSGSGTGTTACGYPGQYYAFGTSSGFWQYTVNTTGYSGITMQIHSSASGTGPHNGVLYYNTGCGTPDVPFASYSLSGTSCGGGTYTLPAACNNIPNLIIKAVVSGGSGSGGTNRINSDGQFNGTATTFPSVAISNTSPIAGNISVGAANNVLQTFNLATTAATATLSGLIINTVGSYTAADITNLKCWYDVSPAFNVATATLLSTLAAPGAAGAKTFPSFIAQTIPAGTTGYLFITADVDPAATATHTISLGTTSFCNINLGSATRSGSGTVAASNPQTIVAGGCTGIPSAGTVSPSPASLCGGGSSLLTLTGGSSGAGLTYQWASSSANTPPGTAILGATNATYAASGVTATTYYWVTSTCATSSLSATSSVGTVTVNSIPTVSATPGSGDICSGGSGLSMTASGANTYVWTPSTGLSASIGTTVTANPTATTTYTVTGTDLSGCTNTATVTVNYNLQPSALTISPSPVVACQGDAAPLLTAAGGSLSDTKVVNSGSITIPGSVVSFGNIATSLAVAGIPAGATITGASVNIINFGSEFQHDYIVNITAPNGKVLNLINQVGTSTSVITTLFSNTILSSSGVTPVSSGSGTFTGTWAADAAPGAGGAPYASNTTLWSDLYSIPNGSWALSIYNNSTFTNTVMTAAQWSVTLNYSYPAATVWAPATGLFTDAAATVPYTGGSTGSVYLDASVPSVNTYTVTATNNVCSSSAIVTATVNPTAAITGTASVCEGLTTSLSNTITGGTWISGSTANATIDPVTGVVTGVAAGTSTITYTSLTGCNMFVTVTVNPAPATITGTANVCEGLTTSLSNTITGGTWTSGSIANATIDPATGIANGIMAGTADITYTLPAGCIATTALTVNPTPSVITGSTVVCEGLTTGLSNTVTGGTWSSLSTANATIDATTGVVTGVASGTATISYVLAAGCSTATTVTVNAAPAAITGIASVCEGLGTTLSDGIAGGTWSSTSNATIDPATGAVAGVSAGTATISYVLSTGCAATTIVTVNTTPVSVTGTMNVCEGVTTTLSDATTGGTWVSTDPSVSVDPATGVVTGVSAGTATVTYGFTTGCNTTTTVTVNPSPAAISGTASMCEGLTTVLSNSGTGTWTSGSGSTASVDPVTGIVTGVSAGTAVITFTSAAGCTATTVVTVSPVPSAISGVASVCEGSVTALTNTGGGSWSSSITSVATINPVTGAVSGVSAGTSTITYQLGTGCQVTKEVTVNAQPSIISGASNLCVGSVITLNDAISGTWSSSVTSVATIDPATGDVTGVSFGSTTIAFISGAGCIRTKNIVVNPLPAAISGTTAVCAGLVTSLSDTDPGGSWTSTDPSVSVDPVTGVVTGISAGTATISYTLPTGCNITELVTVNPTPAAITGTVSACEGLTTALSDIVSGGTWTSSDASVASIDPVTGLVSGIIPGSASVTYTVGTGCYTATAVTINPNPSAITGTPFVCAGSTITLSDASVGGTWSSSTTSSALIGPATGIMTGVATGTSDITYKLPTGCISITTVTVNPLPSVITGSTAICASSTGSLSDVTSGGTWSSSDITVATIGSIGDIVSLSAGTTTITYELPTGCIALTTVTVNPTITPSVSISSGGGTTLCQGTSVTCIASGINGGSAPVYEWEVNGIISGATSVYTFVPVNGDVVRVKLTSNATCAVPDSAVSSITLTVLPNVIPSVSITSSPGDHVCVGGSATFTAIPVLGGTLPTYLWIKNGVSVATGPAYTYVPAQGDDIYCTLTSDLQCVPSTPASSGHIIMSVDSVIVPVFTLNVSPDVYIHTGQTYTFTANVTTVGSFSYKWKVNGMEISGSTASVYVSGTLNGNDSVTCVVTNNNLCAMSSSSSIIMNGSKTGVQSNNLSQNNITVLPNPSNGEFTVRGSLAITGNEEAVIEISDMVGKTIYRKNVLTVNGAVNEKIKIGNTVASGMYMLSIRSGSASQVFKIAIQQ